MLAAEHQARGRDVEILAENFCEMINLFTVSEIASLQKKDAEFFQLLQIMFHTIKGSDSQDCKSFVRVCTSKLRASSVLKYTGPSLLMRGGVQEGGGATGKLTLISLILWIITSVDLIQHPGNAVTASLLTSLVIKLSFGKLSFLTDFLRTTPKSPEFPEKYVNPALGAVTYVSAGEGAFGAAYEKLTERAQALAKDREQLELMKATADHVVEGGLGNLVRCAKSGTCANPVDTLVGTTLAPFKEAQDSRPKLSAEEIANSKALSAIESELRTQEGKWAWGGLGRRKQTLIDLLQENAATLRAAIKALHNVSGLVASLPTLKDRGAVGNMLKAASAAVTDQVREGGRKLDPMMLLANKPRSKPYGNNKLSKGTLQRYKSATQLTSADIEAAGIRSVEIDVNSLAESHPGAELDIVAVHAVGEVNDLLRRVQQTVGALDTTVDTTKIKQLVANEFKHPSPSATPQPFFGLISFEKPTASKKSSAEEIVMSMAFSAAAEAADANTRDLEILAARQLSELFDSNTQKILQDIHGKLTEQLTTLDYPGGRNQAELAAQEAIDISRIFGMRPNIQTMEYARTILQCNTGGPCKKDTFENLQDKTDLIREMKNWSLPNRINHVKYNILFSLMAMLSLGGTADALLLTVIGIAGLPGRWSMWGVEKAQTKQNLDIRAMKAASKRQETLHDTLHQKKQDLLKRALAGDMVARGELENLLAIEASLQGSRGRSRTPPRAVSRGRLPSSGMLALRAPSPRGRSRSPPRQRSQSPLRVSRSRSPPNTLAAARAVGSLRPVSGLTNAQRAEERRRRFARGGSRKIKCRSGKNTRRN